MIDEKSSTNEDVKDVEKSEETVNDNGSSTKTDEKAEKGLRNDLVAERKKRREYEEKLRAYEEKEALQKGEMESLLTKYKSEAEALRAEKEKSESELSKWREYENKKRQSFKDVLGDVPNFDTLPYETLEAMATKLKSKIPDTADDKANKNKGFTLTAKQKQEAYDRFPSRSQEEAEKSYYNIFVNRKKDK